MHISAQENLNVGFQRGDIREMGVVRILVVHGKGMFSSSGIDLSLTTLVS